MHESRGAEQKFPTHLSGGAGSPSALDVATALLLLLLLPGQMKAPGGLCSRPRPQPRWFVQELCSEPRDTLHRAACSKEGRLKGLPCVFFYCVCVSGTLIMLLGNSP